MSTQWHPSRLGMLTVATMLGTTPAVGQDAPRTAEDVEARARAAEEAPLFQSQAPLQMTLRSRIAWLRSERPDDEEADGTITYTADGDAAATVDVKVRTRGNFRRSSRNCRFPPLRLNLPRTRVAGTVFEGQNHLKLVNPCHDERDDYQQYVIQEYLAYRVLQLLTPASFRVRLVDITYEDVDGEYETRTRTGFLIEDAEAMAERNRATHLEVEQLHPHLVDHESAWTVALFQYMIGNTDWSGVFFHNVELIQPTAGSYLIVPYDFDFSGVVSARYARPAPELGTRHVRERVFRGVCRPGVDHGAIIERFLAIRPEVEGLYRETDRLEEGQRNRVLSYYEDFWKMLADEGRYRRGIAEACRSLGDD